MATSNSRGRIGYCEWISCRVPSCPYNTTGIKVSNWWLFLCLTYFSCFLVGIAFAVAGFTSMGLEMAAVGVVIVIVGACLAFICDVLRRCGCGWTKIAPQSSHPRQIVQEASDAVLPIPFLPGYPGFSTAGVQMQSDNPPPYAISPGFESPDDSVDGSSLTCSCWTTFNRTENAQACFENPLDRHAMTSDASHNVISSRTQNLSDMAVVLVTPTSLEHGTLNPPPPPYDFETTDSVDTISWLYDTPPPYEDFV